MNNSVTIIKQGILYYWTKYYKKSVSIINKYQIEQWGVESETNNLRLLRHDKGTLNEYMCTSHQGKSGWKDAPYINFAHLSGRGKPWFRNRAILEKAINTKQNHTTFKDYSDVEYWYWLLTDALKVTGLQDRVSLDFINLEKKGTAAVGAAPSFTGRAIHMRLKAKNGWRQYEYEETEAARGISADTDNKGERILTTANSTGPLMESDRQAHHLVTMLEDFQPRTALKPYLARLETVQNDLESLSRPHRLPGEHITSGRKPKSAALTADKFTDARKWAYAFLLGGARSNASGTEYLGGLYSVVASVYQLRKLGSRADFVLMVQIAAKSPHHKLADFEEEILQKMNIKVVYIPKFANADLECFYSRKCLPKFIYI